MIEEEEVVSRRQRFVTFKSWETVNLVAMDMYMMTMRSVYAMMMEMYDKRARNELRTNEQTTI